MTCDENALFDDERACIAFTRITVRSEARPLSIQGIFRLIRLTIVSQVYEPQGRSCGSGRQEWNDGCCQFPRHELVVILEGRAVIPRLRNVNLLLYVY